MYQPVATNVSVFKCFCSVLLRPMECSSGIILYDFIIKMTPVSMVLMKNCD